MKTLSILGSTGSVGCSTLDVVAEVNEKSLARGEAPQFEVVVLTAFNNAKCLIEQALKYRPKMVAIVDAQAGQAVKAALQNSGIEVGIGIEALNAAAAIDSDMVMAAIVGAAGLFPTLIAVQRGAKILLANKECLVSAGELFVNSAKKYGAEIVPVDSEHNAIFQVMDDTKMVEKLILTASGGPFRTLEANDFANITPEQACKHPNWEMGKKISVDSATMMNKGLELIEAAYLFNMPESMIDILIHPQSIVHSMVCYQDGSVLAQMGAPDMRIPIAYALAYPNRIAVATPRLDLTKIHDLQFFAPDILKFPALALARDSLKIGGSAPTLLNAANEVAVHTFLNRNVTFTQISLIVEKSMEAADKMGNLGKMETIEEVMHYDKVGRQIATEIAQSLAK
ncbi:MAG: 1-deoxy-D-xylulose-5-phosphate reductoisomerase [Hyphomonadaceae bacterium]|nr:MAG: 1-deoxy-D-xylulose-5-phosphate reductoisomerase [Hyphomonadaceae bacterium]KAF0185424.1 MAG: 1-deoxy-D-xylulose-5-phosphate reductoisomerase [Hyphomonadaceae bacterium]